MASAAARRRLRGGLRSSAQVDDRRAARTSGPAQTAAFGAIAETSAPSELFHPAVAAWFARRVSRPEPGPGRRLAGDQGRAAYADRRADRLRQDARRLSRRDRRPRPAGSRRDARGRRAGRLRLAAEGALERHPQESRGAARRHPARARSAAAIPTSPSAPSSGPATPRQASAPACAAIRRISS